MPTSLDNELNTIFFLTFHVLCTMSNVDVDKAMANLTILSMVRQNDKVYTSSDIMVIDPPSAQRAFLRRWYGESREGNLARFSEIVHGGMSCISTFLIIEQPSNPVLKDQSGRRTLRLVTALGDARQGLRNLVITYADDPGFTARLTLLIKEVDDFLHSITPSLQATTSPEQRAAVSPLLTIQEIIITPSQY